MRSFSTIYSLIQRLLKARLRLYQILLRRTLQYQSYPCPFLPWLLLLRPRPVPIFVWIIFHHKNPFLTTPLPHLHSWNRYPLEIPSLKQYYLLAALVPQWRQNQPKNKRDVENKFTFYIFHFPPYIFLLYSSTVFSLMEDQLLLYSRKFTVVFANTSRTFQLFKHSFPFLSSSLPYFSSIHHHLIYHSWALPYYCSNEMTILLCRI